MIKKDNPFISRMKDNKESALSNCSKSVEKMFKKFFDKCLKTKFKDKEDYGFIGVIEELTEATMRFAENTQKDQIIEGEDLQCIKLIMIELENLYTEIINCDFDSGKAYYYYDKTSLIRNVFCKNMIKQQILYFNISNGKIFESYKDLYLVINLVNVYYDELLARGFGLNSVLNPFWNFVKANSMSEKEKMETFLGLVNGTLKFQPVYETKAIGYEVKPIAFDEKIIIETKTSYDEAKTLPQTDTIFAFEGEGTNQRLVKKPNVEEGN